MYRSNKELFKHIFDEIIFLESFELKICFNTFS